MQATFAPISLLSIKSHGPMEGLENTIFPFVLEGDTKMLGQYATCSVIGNWRCWGK